MSFEEETELRNSYLFKTTSNIKSYYLWTIQSIEKESLETRREWWNTLPEYLEKKEPLCSWIDAIIRKLGYGKSEHRSEKKEYCSKRRPYTFECDI